MSVRGDAPFNEFILRVAYSSTPNHLIRRNEVMADVGLPLPEPPPTEEEMHRVTAAAKREMLKVLRLRRAAALPEKKR